MKNAIKSGILTAMLAMAAGPQVAQAALYCTGDAECLSKGLSLVKKAAQNGCDARELANSLGSPVMNQGGFDAAVIQGIEICIEKKKYAKGLEKKALKRQERIQKALATPQK